MHLRIRIHQNWHLQFKWNNTVFNFFFSSELHLIIKTERTYCFTTVRNETCGLLKGFLKVVLESLVFILFRPQLHEFTWNLATDKKKSKKNIIIIIYPLYKTCLINQIQTALPRTRSSMTCDSTDTTVVSPIRANAMDATDRMKSPARIA